MTPERYQRLCELFDQAQERDPSQRAAFLEHACADDPSLHAEVEQLLADDQEAWAEKHFGEPCPVNAKELLAGEEPGTASSSPSADAPGDALIGQHVGPYRIEQRLGSGGMGVVYKAQDTRLGRSVAVKFLPAEYAHDRRALERFQREARTASALNHPYICTIHDIDTYLGQPFFVMEFIQGQSLRQFSRQRLPLDVVAQLGEQVAKALAVAHAAGIVHRDIKPDNIMVRDDGYVKVVDFGLARPLPTSIVRAAAELSDVTAPGTLVGTLRYMSPEQGRAETANSASDIFALGIILYELATGHHPFEADSPLAILHGILTHTPVPASQPNPETAGPLETLLQTMLEKDARLRPTAQDVEATLAELIRSHARQPPGSAPLPSQRHTVGRTKERAALGDSFESAALGRGLFACVCGEPGIGKTTLVEDFLAELAVSGRTCTIARGRCSERLAGTEAYLPFLEALDSLLHGAGGEAMARVMRVVAPNWYAQVVPLAAEDSSFVRALVEVKAASQERLKREFGAFLQEVSRLRPSVLFVDDLHWADASTVDLLAYIGSKCVGLRLLLVLTYRPTDLLLSKHPFVPVKQDLQTHGVCREIALELLTRADVERYLALEFPEHRLPEGLAVLIHAKTEGNPLFMVDLLRHLRDRQVLAQEQGRWVLAQSLPDLERELPESVRSMIDRKIAQLGEGDRRLLVAASVQGYEFDSAVVAQALALDAAEVEEQLEGLERIHAFIRLMREQEFPDRTLTLRYRFVHVLYQNALYASLRPTRRASLSAAVAKGMEGYYGEKSAAVAAELALLWEAARDFPRAADYFLLAAQNAVRLFANHEAVVLARRGLQLLETLADTPERAQRELTLQITLGPALMATKGWGAAEV
jgi:serine/threonine protein kinase